MRKRNGTISEGCRLLGADELKSYMNVGITTARKIGRESGAEVHIGRRCLYDREKIDEYISTMLEREKEA